jgi:hypothetical protein
MDHLTISLLVSTRLASGPEHPSRDNGEQTPDHDDLNFTAFHLFCASARQEFSPPSFLRAAFCFEEAAGGARRGFGGGRRLAGFGWWGGGGGGGIVAGQRLGDGSVGAEEFGAHVLGGHGLGGADLIAACQ